ncbi:MAG: hypothetical protein QM778_28060 [Myxococcales bacterium]
MSWPWLVTACSVVALWFAVLAPMASASAQTPDASPVPTCSYLESETCRNERIAALVAERRALIRARRTPRYHRIRAVGFSLMGLGGGSLVVGALLLIGDSDLGENGHQSGPATTVGVVLMSSAPVLILVGGAMALGAKLRTTRQPRVREINREIRELKSSGPAAFSLVPVVPRTSGAPWGIALRRTF